MKIRNSGAHTGGSTARKHADTPVLYAATDALAGAGSGEPALSE